jgi:hypothetical protein
MPAQRKPRGRVPVSQSESFSDKIHMMIRREERGGNTRSSSLACQRLGPRSSSSCQTARSAQVLADLAPCAMKLKPHSVERYAKVRAAVRRVPPASQRASVRSAPPALFLQSRGRSRVLRVNVFCGRATTRMGWSLSFLTTAQRRAQSRQAPSRVRSHRENGPAP